MKKLSYFIAGTLVGASIMTAGSVFADDVKQLLNSKVGSVWELHVDGKQVGEVPIIKGSSYAPVRQIAEIAGFNVEFETGKVFLETKGRSDIVTDGEIKGIELHIAHYEEMIIMQEVERDRIQSKIESTNGSEAVESLKATLVRIDARIAEYEAEIAALNVKLAEAKAKQAAQSSK